MADQPDNTLYLIDGHAQMFRSYHAIRGGMSSPVTGEPTNATFAFTGMLLKLFKDYHPAYAAMAIDSDDSKTFRHEIYPEYKANRSEAPEDFGPQVPRMLEVTRLFGVPVLEVPGDEADDIIATLATRLAEAHPDLRVRIVSKDKDLEQVLTDRITLFDAHTDTELDVPGLAEKKGITPQQVIDYQTLIGDSTDNIPGVPGIGPKTASKLLERFGTVDNLIAHVDELKGKQKENIEAAITSGDLNLSRQLVTLKRDVDCEVSLDEAKVGGIDGAALHGVFKQLGFHRHVTDLDHLLGNKKNADKPDDQGGLFGATLFDSGSTDGGVAVNLRKAEACDYRAIKTRDELDRLIKNLESQALIAVDTETIGLGHSAELCGICLAWEKDAAVYVPVASPNPDEHLDRDTVLQSLKPVLENPGIPKCGHNIKYDLLVLKHAGVELRGIVFDSMIGAFLAGMPGQGMDALALSMLERELIPISDLIGPRKNASGRKVEQKTMDQVPLDLVTPYAAEDADVTLQLTGLLRPKIAEMEMTRLCDAVETPLITVLADMEDAGIRVDPEELDRQREALQARIDDLRDEIHETAGGAFNIDSPKQLAEVLFTKLGLPVIKKTKTGVSTDVEVLEKLCERDDIEEELQRVPRLVVEYRQLTKLVGTYLVSLKEAIREDSGRIHASFHQTGAATGRLSSSGPNLQNIPIRTDIGREIRKAFVAEPGYRLVSADYSQIELRMLAHLSDDANLIQAFADGIDIHTAVAAQVFDLDLDDVTADQRAHAKVINFGIIYGVTPYGLARRIEGLDLDGAKALIADYKARFTGIDRFLDQCVDHAVQHGYVTTILGRRRWIEEVNARNPQRRALGERLAINSVVQGSAADLIKLAMVNLHRRVLNESLPMRLLLQIHDELVIEAPEPDAEAMAAVLRQEMEGAMDLKAPLKVDLGIGEDWYETK